MEKSASLGANETGALGCWLAELAVRLSGKSG